MKKNTSIPLYQNIVNNIKAKILNCTYLPGDSIESLTEICSNYGVSKITASSVIARLEDEGYVKRIHGKGTFVTANNLKKETSQTYRKIKSIVLISLFPADFTDKKNMLHQIFQGIFERASELSVDVKIKHVSFNDMSNEVLINSLHDIKPEEGVILYYYNNSVLFNSIFYGMGIKGVIIDGVYPGAFSSVTDNSYGMTELVNHLHDLGHKKMLMCYKFSGPSCAFNANERCDSFLRETERLGISGEIFEGSSFTELLELMKSPQKPSVILFTQDAPAVKFIKILENAGYKVPEDVNICGFDDVHQTDKDFDRLTTVHVDTENLGRNAVDILMKKELPHASAQISLWKRVKPHLIKRSSTCFCNI